MVNGIKLFYEVQVYHNYLQALLRLLENIVAKDQVKNDGASHSSPMSFLQKYIVNCRTNSI